LRAKIALEAVRDQASVFQKASAKYCHTSKSKSSNAPIVRKVLNFYHDVGLSDAPSRGSIAAAGYRKVLDAAGMIQSMSRKGNCWDNAPMESCLGTLKTELVHQACYKTRNAARHDLFAYIEGYYNRQRLHSALGYITPEQAERQAT
jgi:putative transposase